MGYLEIIAIFVAPIMGVLIFTNKDFRVLKEIFPNYLFSLILSNLLSQSILFIFSYQFPIPFYPSFFVKYTLLNLLFSVVIALLDLAIQSKTKISIDIEDVKSSKK